MTIDIIITSSDSDDYGVVYQGEAPKGVTLRNLGSTLKEFFPLFDWDFDGEIWTANVDKDGDFYLTAELFD